MKLPKWLIVLSAIIIIWVPAWFTAFTVRHAQISACERGNISRVSELRQRQNLLQNAKTRAADPATKEEGQAAVERAKLRKAELINSQKEFAVEPGSVVSNCDEAFPKPFPFNIDI